MDTKLVTKYGIEKVATKQNLEKLKKLEREEKIRLFPVYKDLPRLGPYILLALLAGVILANPVAYFLFL